MNKTLETIYNYRYSCEYGFIQFLDKKYSWVVEISQIL